MSLEHVGILLIILGVWTLVSWVGGMAAARRIRKDCQQIYEEARQERVKRALAWLGYSEAEQEDKE
jgi:hypothetical protein